MGLIFNLTIILCLILHQTLSAQIEANEELTIEMRQMKDNMSYLMSAVEKLQIEVQNSKTIELKLEKQISDLNETLERALNMSKINSDEIDSIRKCLNISIKGCSEDNITHSIGPTQPPINQNKCNISEPSQLFRLSLDTLVYTWKNLHVSNLIEKTSKWMESEVFSLDKHGINAQVKMEIRFNGDVCPVLRFLRKQPSDTWPVKVLPRVFYVMKVEKKGNVIDTSIGTGINALNSSLKYDTYDYRFFFEYYYWKPKPKYEMGETFSLEVHVKTPEMSNQFHSKNMTFTGSICPYAKIMEWTFAYKIGRKLRHYFYTSPKGYRAIIEFQIGYDEWLFVAIHISKGLHDSNLKPPKWKGKVTFINQADASKSVTEEYDTDSFIFFAKPSNLSEFVVDDELKYEATIDIID